MEDIFQIGKAPTNRGKLGMYMSVTINKKVYVSKPFIDKISMVMNIENTKEQESIANLFKGWCENYCAKPGGYSPNYRHVCDIDSEDGMTSAIRMECSPKKSNISSFLRIEYNPSKTSTGYLRAHVDQLFFGGYKRLINESRVTRADIAIDISDININNLLVNAAKFTKTSTYKFFIEFYKSETETIYLGEADGPKRLIIYNKKKQMKGSDEKINALKHLTRIEARLRFKGSKFSPLGLCEISNPFSDVTINYISSFSMNDQTIRLAALLSQSSTTKVALSALDKKDRKRFIKFLKMYNCDWWEKSKHWDEWPQIVFKTFEPQQADF